MLEIQLYAYPTSPYAQKVGCYLKYKRLDFKFVAVNPLHRREIAFTRQDQVPVMKIGSEWRKESSQLGVWLDELYPERPILPMVDGHLKSVLEADRWVSDNLIPSVFRYAVEWQNTWQAMTNGWRLSRAVNSATPLPLYVRLLWPLAIKRAPFIINMVKQMDLNETLPEMNLRLQSEFLAHLDGGLYLANQPNVTLVDLSAFPIVMNGHFMGIKAKQTLRDNPEIMSWAKRVYSQLPENPTLVPDDILKVRSI